MEKREFVKRWKREFKRKTDNEPVYIELNDGSVLYATKYTHSKNFSGHIRLFLGKEVIGHISICSVVDVF